MFANKAHSIIPVYVTQAEQWEMEPRLWLLEQPPCPYSVWRKDWAKSAWIPPVASPVVLKSHKTFASLSELWNCTNFWSCKYCSASVLTLLCQSNAVSGVWWAKGYTCICFRLSWIVLQVVLQAHISFPQLRMLHHLRCPWWSDPATTFWSCHSRKACIFSSPCFIC